MLTLYCIMFFLSIDKEKFKVHIQYNPMHTYQGASPTELIGSYFLINVFQITALIGINYYTPLRIEYYTPLLGNYCIIRTLQKL